MQPNFRSFSFVFFLFKDDELDEETKSLLDSSHEDAVLEDPIHEDAVLKTPPNSIKSPDDSPPASEIVPTKKVVLKRKQIIPIQTEQTADDQSTDPSGDNSTEPKSKLTKTTASDSGAANESVENKSAIESSSSDTEKKVVKLSELSAKERLEMRAKKFGAPVSIDSLKSARAERFGLSATSTITASATANSENGGKNGVSVETLKKRAERFGGSVSKVMTKIENFEKLQKRRERFGAAAAAAAEKSTVTATATDYEEKAKLRLKKFSQPAATTN